VLEAGVGTANTDAAVTDVAVAVAIAEVVGAGVEGGGSGSKGVMIEFEMGMGARGRGGSRQERVSACMHAMSSKLVASTWQTWSLSTVSFRMAGLAARV
jgi:hypothetical protein